jgi:Ankyrin repeats (3 copies)
MGSKTQTFLFALLGLGRGGRILYVTLFVLAVPALMVWTLVLPRFQFSDEDERLFRAARHGDVASIEQSLDAGAGVDAAAPVDGKTALFRAAVFGHADAVRALLARGADPARRGSDGRTALEIVTEAVAEEHDPSAARALEGVAGLLRGAASSK